MEFKQLQDMALFALVAECGSFTAAAQRVGLPKSSVSQRISQLEQTLGLRLLNRTTRQLNLTFAGERYLEHCQAMMSAAERADLALQRLRDNPSGRLRISTPAGLGATGGAAGGGFSAPVPGRFAGGVGVRCHGGSGTGRLRRRVAHRQAAGFFADRSPSRVCAALSVGGAVYLAQHPPIEHPQQLQQHRCIAHRARTAGTCAAATTTTVGSCRWRTPPTTCCMRVNALSPVRGSRCCRRFSAARWWRRSCWWKSCRRGARRAMSCIWSTRAAS